MKIKVILILAICAAVISAGISAVVVTNKRAEIARNMRDKSENDLEQKEQIAKAETAKRDAETEKRRAAEANEKAEAEKLETEKLAVKRAADEKVTATETRKAAEAAAAKARAESETAASNRDAAKAAAKAARDQKDRAAKEAETAVAKAQAEQSRLETEKTKIKAQELRQQNFVAWEQKLTEWQTELTAAKADIDAREAALRPDKTSASLDWVGGDEDTIMTTNGTMRVKKRPPYRAENDLTLPRATRNLAKTERLLYEQTTNDAAVVRAAIVKSVEDLYVAAVREDRVVDANYYKNCLKTLYPDWEYKAADAKKEESK